MTQCKNRIKKSKNSTPQSVDPMATSRNADPKTMRGGRGADMMSGEARSGAWGSGEDVEIEETQWQYEPQLTKGLHM